METKFLETFLAVVKAGSIAGAARNLDLAPTTITQQMKALEKATGCALLVRSGHTVGPTSAGYRILERAHHLVRDVQDLCIIAGTHTLPPGPLRLGAMHSALTRLLPGALKDWNKLYPDIRIFIQPGDSIPLLHLVAKGDIDAAIIGDPLFKIPKTCDWHMLREEELVLITPEDMQATNPLEIIKNKIFIRSDRSYMVGKLVDGFLQLHHISPRSQFELDGIEAITHFVRMGLGVSILPRGPRGSDHEAGVRYWTLPGPVPRRKIGFVTARTSVHLPLAGEMLGILKKLEE